MPTPLYAIPFPPHVLASNNRGSYSSGSSSLQPPLSATATLPNTPRVSSMSTPLFTPPPGSAMPFFQSVQTEAESTPEDPPMHVMLLTTGLPLPGQILPRNESESSISSIKNDCGCLDTEMEVPRDFSPTSSTPMQAFAPQSNDGLVNFPSAENLRSQDRSRTSDPPLLPSIAKLPDLSRVAQHSTFPQRPISPFSPSQASYPGNIQTIHSRRISTPDPDRDLIDFASETASLHDQTMLYHTQDSMRMSDEQYFDYHEEDEDFSSDGEDEYDNNPLYMALSNASKLGGSPYLRRAWDTSRILLVPPKYSVSHDFLTSDKTLVSEEQSGRARDWERYAGLHALRQQTGSPDVFVGYGRTTDGKRLHARLDSSRGEVEICIEDEEDNPREKVTSDRPLSLTSSLSRTDTASSCSAIPPHLQISSSPTSSTESSHFPITPPISPPLRPTIAVRSASGNQLATGLGLGDIAFPSMEPLMQMPKKALSPSRRIKIVAEEAVYRSRKNSSTVNLLQNSVSAPTALPGTSAGSAISSLNGSNATVPGGSLGSSLDAPQPQQLQPAKAVKKRDSKVRLRVPKWLGGGSKEKLNSSITKQDSGSAPSTPAVPQPLVVPASVQNTIIEKLRIIRVDNYVIEWPGQAEALPPPPTPVARQRPVSNYSSEHLPTTPASAPLMTTSSSRSDRRSSVHSLATPDLQRHRRSISGWNTYNGNARHASFRHSRRSSNLMGYKQSNASSASQLNTSTKDFASDIAFFLDPPDHFQRFATLFEQALREIVRLTRDFCSQFDYYDGRAEAIKECLRVSILQHVWQPFDQQDINNREKDRIYESVENIIMSFVHQRLYEQGVKMQYAIDDAALSEIISIYRTSEVTMADFGVSSLVDTSFSAAIETLAELSGGGYARAELWEKMSSPSYKKLVLLIGQTTDSASTVIALLEAKPPLDCASLLRRIIDETVKAAESDGASSEGARNSLATDDLIPLLAWMMVKAGSQALNALLFYTKTFRLSNESAADLDWAIVQFEAAVHFLRTDPLHLLKMHSRSASPALTSASLSPVQQMCSVMGSQEDLALPHRSRRASIQSLPSNQISSGLRSPMLPVTTSSSIQSCSTGHNRTMSSLPGSRVVTYQSSGNGHSGKVMTRSSTISTMVGDEDDHADMPPPPIPKRESRTSVDNARDRPDISLLNRSRHRHTSSYSLASTELQIRPQIVLRPQAIRPPTRAFHVSQDLSTHDTSTSQPTRIPFGRSQTTPLNQNGMSAGWTRQMGSTNSHLARSSIDLQRSGSEGSRRNATNAAEWWGWKARVPTPASPPMGSEGSRPDSPASPATRLVDTQSSERGSFDLERSTSDISWLEWGRKRLSSMTSSTSLVDSAEGPPKSIADLVAERIATTNQSSSAILTQNRPRRKSESAAAMLNSAPVQFEDAISEDASETGSVPPPQHHHSASIGSANEPRPRHLTYTGSRPRSTLSLSSLSSVDTESSLGLPAHYHTTTPSFSRSTSSALGKGIGAGSSLSRSRRFKRELLSANMTPGLALPPQLQLDTASVTSSNYDKSSPVAASKLSPLLDSIPSSGSTGSGWPNHHSYSSMHSRYLGTPFSPIQEVANFTPSPELKPSSAGKEAIPVSPTLRNLSHAPPSLPSVTNKSGNFEATSS